MSSVIHKNIREYFNELMGYMEHIKVINTHSHHGRDQEFDGFNLDTLLRRSYIGWHVIPSGNTYNARNDYLDKVRYNSYFVWLQKGIQGLYNREQPLSSNNWDEITMKIADTHKDSNKHIKILKEQCAYDKVILDAYWDPGSDNGYADIFAPAYRINMFLFGYNRYAKDHNGNNPFDVYGGDIKDIDEYIYFIREIIKAKKAQGCIALKSAIAYDRGLDFRETTKERAQKIYNAPGEPSQEDIKSFQDYVFFEICKIAAELDMPIQNHTGLGLLKKTNAMQMQEVIAKHPDTKFVLFHGSYPWLDDIYGLTHVYSNVYPDLCWLPLISTSAAERMVSELIEVSIADKVCWGCDTWTAEESYGALLAIRFILAKVLSEKVENGYFSIEDAKNIVSNILYHNAKKLYGF